MLPCAPECPPGHLALAASAPVARSMAWGNSSKAPASLQELPPGVFQRDEAPFCTHRQLSKKQSRKAGQKITRALPQRALRGVTPSCRRRTAPKGRPLGLTGLHPQANPLYSSLLKAPGARGVPLLRPRTDKWFWGPAGCHQPLGTLPVPGKPASSIPVPAGL